jgi:4-hydroxybenzoate polyprenyltransferase
MKTESPMNLATSFDSQSGWDEFREVAHDSVRKTSNISALSLCVDLDGALIKSDTVVDSVLALARQNPMVLFATLSQIFRGREIFKQQLSKVVHLDVASLPYNQSLLGYLFEQYADGRPISLATTDRILAERVAAHLGIFTEVVAFDSAQNLTAEEKYAALRKQIGETFAYIGSTVQDLFALAHCKQPMVANPTEKLRAKLRCAGLNPTRLFLDTAPRLQVWMRAMRLHQWAKNMLIFLPLLLAHPWVLGGQTAVSIGLFAAAAIAFFSFGFCASATYILNDLLDVEADRRHPKKRHRPFAAGDLSARSGVLAIFLLLACSLLLALALPRIVTAFGAPLDNSFGLLAWLMIYAVSTSAYSLWLKRIPLVDVVVLSGLYTVRIIAGSVATGVSISTWLAGFSVFFFLALAYVKRFAELQSLSLRSAKPANGRGYLIADIEQVRSLGTASAFASVVVLTLYISNLNTNLYHHPGRLWLLLPLFLLWISRLWLLAGRGSLNEDPVIYAVTDKRSLLQGMLVLGVVLSAL